MRLQTFGFILSLAVLSGVTASAADRYWISSTAKNWSDSSAWSATAGGAGGATVPESGDIAFFGSYGLGNCTITGSLTVDRIEIASGYSGIVIQGSSVTVMTGALVLNGNFRMGTNGKLQLTDAGTPLSGYGTLDTSTNTPNTVEYKGGDDIGIVSSAPVSAYSNLALTPPGGISRSGIFVGNPDEQYFDMAAVDSAAGFLYVGSKNAPAKIVKIRLSDYTRVGTLTLASGENDLSPAVAIDSANGYLYAGTRTTPAKIVKIRLSDFTRVGAVTLNSGEDQLWAATIDCSGGYAYFGTRTSPGRIVKLRLSDFTRDSAITLASGENEVLGACIDPTAGFAYFGLQTYPGKVVKVQLSDFTKVGTLTFNTGEDRIRVGVIDPAEGYAYFGTRTSPGKVVRVRLSDFTRDAALTMNTGENELYSGVIDTAGGNAYFGAYTNPGIVIKVKLSDFTRADSVTLGFNEKYLDTAAIDASAGFAYFMTDNWTGKSIKINLNYVSATWRHATPLDVNGSLSIGAGTLDSVGQNISVAGNWSNAGTFNPGLNTVTLDGSNQTVSGNNTFRNLTKTVSSAAVLTFESGKLQQVAGTLNLQGASGQLLSICSNSTGQSWRLAAENYQTTRYASIKDTNASEGRTLIALSSTDGGNNQNVVFPSPAQVSITTPNSSATSPAWVEGTNGGDGSSVTVSVNSGTPFNAVRLSPTKWFADNASSGGAALGVSLSPAATTHVEVTASNPFSNSNTATQDISWMATDLKDKSFSSDTIRIRKGDSLLLTATGSGTTLLIDGQDDGTFESSGVPGQKFPTAYNTAGTFIARAKIDGVEVGSISVVVVSVNMHAPIACQVDYQREKIVTVESAMETANVVFQSSDTFCLAVSLKEQVASGANLFLKPERRGTPILEARLCENAGPIIAFQEIDEFTLEVPGKFGAVFDGNSGIGRSEVIIRPYIPNIQLNFNMFASTSTFENGLTSFQSNTNSSIQEVDPHTGENTGRISFEIWQPAGEDKFCFDVSAKQGDSPVYLVGVQLGNNGYSCKVWVAGGVFVPQECTDEDSDKLQVLQEWISKKRYFSFMTTKGPQKFRLRLVDHLCPPDGDDLCESVLPEMLAARLAPCETTADVASPCHEKELRFLQETDLCNHLWPFSVPLLGDCFPCDGECYDKNMKSKPLNGISTGSFPAAYDVDILDCYGSRLGTLQREFKVIRVEADGYAGANDTSTRNPFPTIFKVSTQDTENPLLKKSIGVPFHVTSRGPEGVAINVRVYSKDNNKLFVSDQPELLFATGDVPLPPVNCVQFSLTPGPTCFDGKILYMHGIPGKSGVTEIEVQAEETHYVCSGGSFIADKVWVVADTEKVASVDIAVETCCLCEQVTKANGLAVTLLGEPSGASPFKLVLVRSNQSNKAFTASDEPGPRFDEILGPRFKQLNFGSNIFAVNGGPTEGEYSVYVTSGNLFVECGSICVADPNVTEEQLQIANTCPPAPNKPFTPGNIPGGVGGARLNLVKDDCGNTFQIWCHGNHFKAIWTEDCITVDSGKIGECVVPVGKNRCFIRTATCNEKSIIVGVRWLNVDPIKSNGKYTWREFVWDACKNKLKFKKFKSPTPPISWESGYVDAYDGPTDDTTDDTLEESYEKSRPLGVNEDPDAPDAD